MEVIVGARSKADLLYINEIAALLTCRCTLRQMMDRKDTKVSTSISLEKLLACHSEEPIRHAVCDVMKSDSPIDQVFAWTGADAQACI